MTDQDPSFDIHYVADLARLKLDEEEAETYAAQLAKIITHVEKLRTLDVDHIEPTAHATPQFDVTRPDQHRPSIPRDSALANAPQSLKNQFQVPKVVE